VVGVELIGVANPLVGLGIGGDGEGEFEPAGAGALLGGVTAGSVGAGALVGWLAGSVGYGVLVGAFVGIPAGVFAVYKRYKDAF